MKFELTFDSINLYRQSTNTWLTVSAPRIIHRAETMMQVPNDIWVWANIFFGADNGNFIIHHYSNSE